MSEISQRDYWEHQHLKRKDEFEILRDRPNVFAEECLKYIPKNGNILEIGAANGRDARYFAREKGVKVVAVDFSREALRQLIEASKKDNTSDLVFPLVADIKQLALVKQDHFDAIYSRSALHLSDKEIDIFFDHAIEILKYGGYFMIEGKTRDDPEISMSKEVAPNLFVDLSGHLRRAWDEYTIRQFLDKCGLKLISSKKTEEIWQGDRTNFINFIAQKI